LIDENHVEELINVKEAEHFTLLPFAGLERNLGLGQGFTASLTWTL